MQYQCAAGIIAICKLLYKKPNVVQRLGILEVGFYFK